MTIAIDSNVFIYVLEQNREFWQDALAVLKTVESGMVIGIASQLVCLEVLSDAKLTSKQLATTEHFLAASLAMFVDVDRAVLLEAARLRREHKALKTPDAIHLTTAIAHRCDYFVTNDAALLKLKLPNIKIINLRGINRLAP